MIQCGDELAETYPALISQYEADTGNKVEVQLIGWAQCQDKATTLAAAGDPVALAYMGSRTLKQLSQNDLIIPIPYTEEEKASYYPHIMDTVTFGGAQWGIPTAFSTKGAVLEQEAVCRRRSRSRDAAHDLGRAVRHGQDDQGQDRYPPGFGLAAKTMDNTMHQFLHFVYTNDGLVLDADDNVVLDSPQNLEALEFYKKLVDVSEEGPTAYEQNDLTQLFNDSQVAMIEQGPWVARSERPKGSIGAWPRFRSDRRPRVPARC